MGTITTGKFVGSDAAFKTRKSKSLSSSMRLGSQRKDSLEKKAIDDKRNQEQAKTKEISRREKERKAMQSDLQKRVASEETNPNRNTDERRKVVNVGRPDTAKNPMDTRAKLVKQAEIKNKIIEDQEKSMTLQKYHNLPDDLVSAVRSVLEGKNPFAKKDDDDKKKPSKKDDDDADDKDTKAKKSDDDDDDDKDTKSKSKKSDDDDDQDKPIGKNGKKTKVDIEPNMKTANEEVEAEHIAEEKTHTVWFQKGTKVGARSARGIGVTAKNDKHAIEVAKQQFPDHKNGWFVDKIKSHVKEEVTLSDEETARILAKLEEAKGSDDEDHQDGPEHIVMQLRKAKSLGANNRPIHFHDGSKVKVHAAHVQKALDMHGSFKKAPEKDEFTQKLQASHASFKKAIGEK